LFNTEELVDLLQQSPDPVAHWNDVFGGETPVGSSIQFIRPGLVNFDKFGKIVGQIFSFYAGYGSFFDRDGVEAWLQACAVPSVGKTWEEASLLPGSRRFSTCGDELLRMMRAYHRGFERNPDAPNRWNDKIGQYIPAFVSVGVLTGDAVDIWKQAKEQYYTEANFNISFADMGMNFDDFKIGYWGNEEELERVKENLPIFFNESILAEKFVALGEATWRTAFALSPREPGLGSGVYLPSSGVVSIGGWPDRSSTQAVIAFNKSTTTIAVQSQFLPDGPFLEGYLQSPLGFGGTLQDGIDMYAITGSNSSYMRSLIAADAVMCAAYDTLQGPNTEEIFSSGYFAPIESDDPFFLNGSYDNVSPDLGLLGCSVVME